MKFAAWLTLFAFLLPVAAQELHPQPAAPAAVKDDPPAKAKPRGLKPTPRHKLAAIAQHSAKGITLPASVVYVPQKLSMWLNDQYGDCVTAEEAFNQAAMGVFITDQTVLTWARGNDYLNGAMLPDVMDSMIKSGFKQDGNVYSIGSYSAVNFTDPASLQAALTIGPVNIGIDANALPSGAGNHMGWTATGGRPGQFGNEDHCVSIAGYGPATTLFAAVGTPVPAGFSTTKTYYLLFTWNTIGVIDHEWLMSTCGEAYIRNPAALKNGQPNPSPAPPTPVPPGPNPVPPAPGPAGGYTGKIAVVQEYADGVKKGDPVTIVGYTGAGSSAVAADLDKAGVSPATKAAVLKLLLDVLAKAGKDVILADLLAVLGSL